MRVIHVTQSGSGVTGGRRTQVIVSRTGPQGPAGGGGGGGATSLDELSDVALVGTTTGDFLRYNGTAWTDTKIVASDLGTGTADAFHFLAGDLTWQDAVPLDVSAKNTTASTISKGTPVYITGSVGSGHTVEVAPADAANSGTMSSIGLVVTDLAAGATGYVRTMGVLEGVSTGAYSINQTLYVGSGGGLTNVRPTGTTTLVQNIGRVMRANNQTGTVLIVGPGRVNDVPNRIGTTYLADGTAGASNYLRGDQTWSTISATDVGAAPSTRNLTASTGLSGGGDLSADRSFSVLYGTTAGTAAQGNDSRIAGAVQSTRNVSSGTGLSGGGDLSADRTLSVLYGTTAGTAAQGNDTRITGAAQKASNLSDLGTLSTARSNLGVSPVGSGYVSSVNVSGLIAETLSPSMLSAGNQALLSSGRLQMVGIYVPAGTTVTSISFCSGTTALATGTNQWFVLTDSGRSALRYTVDDTSTAWAAHTVKTLALTSTYTVSTSGLYYLGIMVAATTVPTLRGISMSNVALSGESFQSSTGQTTPPATGTTFTLGTRQGTLPWAAIS